MRIWAQILPSAKIIPRRPISHKNLITPSPFCRHVLSADHFLHWMTPYGLTKLHELSHFLPPHIVACEHIIMVRAIKPKMLSNYGTGLLRFTQFCDNFNIPESIRMPTPEWLLSHFITTHGTGSVGGGSLRTWLLGLELWHIINSAPW